MSKKRYKTEEIIQHLRTLEIGRAEGKSIADVARSIGVHPVTISKWKREYGGLDISQAKKLKDLEKENSRLKRLLADAELDKLILKEVVSGKY